MNSQAIKEFAIRKKHMLLIIVPVLLIAVGLLVYFSNSKTSLSNVPLFSKAPKVAIKSEYKNPFDQKTQYVNPFEEYKNPFVVNR